MAKRKKEKPKPPPPIYAAEREQVRIRRKHEFPLAMDDYGRERAPQVTAESRRQYEESSGGIVRLRLADPLKTITGLSTRQRNAGLRFRADYEVAATSGIKPASMAERVDSSGLPRGAPAHVLDAFGALATARQVLGHHEIAMVVENVCGLRMSIREISDRTKDPRPALAKLLSIGLDHLANHYFGGVHIENRTSLSKKS
jgi:Domain of unknown function (DUF6456)